MSGYFFGRCLPAVMLLVLAGTAQAAQPIPISDFFTGNVYSRPRLSPDGKYLAVIAPDPGDQDRRIVDVFDLDTMKLFRRFRPNNAFRTGNIDIPMALYWVSNKLLMFSTGFDTGSFNSLAAMGQIHTVDIEANHRSEGHGEWTTTNYQILRVVPGCSIPSSLPFIRRIVRFRHWECGSARSTGRGPMN